MVSLLNLYPITRAGTPPTIAYLGTLIVTTAPAATTLPRPRQTPLRMTALDHLQ